MMHRSVPTTRLRAFALVSGVVLLAILGCTEAGKKGPAADKGRVIVIGIDGASPLVARPMIEAGRLPNLAMIAEQGVSGRLRSLPPLFSPRIWNTIGTGKLPEEHGIKAFVQKDESGKKRLYDSNDRQVPGVWNILSEAGIDVGVVNWWTTYPPDEIEGVMVSDHFFPEQIDMIKGTFDHEGPESSGAHFTFSATIHPIPNWRTRSSMP